MFLTKQKKIEHLQEIIGLKEAEIKAVKNERQAEKKRLFAALNENLKLKRRVEICDAMAAKQVQKALEREARQKRQRIYAACAKMRRQIKTQQQTIEVLQHNIHAIMATYEQCDDRNRQLEGLTREQGGRLAVYEKLVGEIPRHEAVSE